MSIEDSGLIEDVFVPPLQLHDWQLGSELNRETFSNNPGVYYFFDKDNLPLYIGKSIHIRQRLLSHLNRGRSEERVERMVQQTSRLGWRETQGDMHAQLLENRQIKELTPVFNRAQRRLKRFYSWRLADGRVKLELEQFTHESFAQRSQVIYYGIYKTMRAAKAAMMTLAERERLCLQVLGLERGRAACFRSQIGKCAGACDGRESVGDMMSRLLGALLPLCLDLWPYAEPVQLQEGELWHVLYQWQSFGASPIKLSQSQLKRWLGRAPVRFDKDEYLIIRRFLKRDGDSAALVGSDLVERELTE